MAKTPNDELSTMEDAALDVATLSYDELYASTEDRVVSLLILDKAEMVRVPFIITGARFSPGKGDADFVSLEVTTKDNVRGVINDGGSGIRRQFVAWLATKGWIDPGEGEESGKETRYDSRADSWDYKSDNVDLRFDEFGKAHVQITGFALRCDNGLRRSDYTNESGEATTYYLA